MSNGTGNYCWCATLLCLFVLLSAIGGASQTKAAFELSGHFTTLNVGEYAPGFGGTLAYNLHPRFAVESTLNFFPSNPHTNLGRSIVPLGDLNTGNILQGQFGAKANLLRLKRVTLFAKAKPGFVTFSKLSYHFDAGIGAFDSGVWWDAGRQTGFALDVGVGAEIAPVKDSFIRFDAGDTYFQYPSFTTTFNAVPGAGIQPVFHMPAASVHTFQFSVGVGCRFGRTK